MRVCSTAAVVFALLGAASVARARDDHDMLPPLNGNSGFLPPFIQKGFSLVNEKTGNPRNIFKNVRANSARLDGYRAPPATEWWEPLVTSGNATTPVVQTYPLMLRMDYSKCSYSVSKTTFVSTLHSRETPFISSVVVTVGQFPADGCFPQVVEHDTTGVDISMLSKHKPTGVTINPTVGNLMLARGHPYITLSLQNHPVAIKFSSGINRVSRISVPETTPLALTADHLDVVDANGDRWLLALPALHAVNVHSDGRVVLPGSVQGFLRVAYIPVDVSHHADGTVGNFPDATYEVVRQNSKCIVTGTKVSHNNTAVGGAQPGSPIALTHEFRTNPVVCNPLMLTLPHHRALDVTSNSAGLLYKSLLGDLEGTVAKSWVMHVPRTDPVDPPGIVSTYNQCTEMRLYDEFLEDMNNLGNGTVLAADSYGVQLHHLGHLAKTAKRMNAHKQFELVLQYAKKWINQLLDGNLVYNPDWGMMCIKKEYPLVGQDDITCYGGGQLEEFGYLQQGLLRLWDHLLNDAPGIAETNRMLDKLRRIAGTLARHTVNQAESDEFFAVARGFDWYTGLAFDTYGLKYDLTTGNIRQVSKPGAALTAYSATAVLGMPRYIGNPYIALAGQVLYSLEAYSVKAYIDTTATHGKDGQGVIAEVLQDTKIERGDDVHNMFTPYDHPVVPNAGSLVTRWANVTKHFPAVAGRPLAETLSKQLLSPDEPWFDIMLYSVLNPSSALETHVTESVRTPGFKYTNASSNTQVGDLEYLLDVGGPYSCSASFELPIRVVGTTIWFNNSFNYMFKMIDYQPTVIGQSVTTYNIYQMDLYGDMLRRDVDMIKSLGFNTIQISTNTFEVDGFIEMCKAKDLNIIVSQILPASGFKGDKFQAEHDFTTMLRYLSNHTNIVMWTVTSTALTNIAADEGLYDYYVLLHKLRLLRDTYDAKKRPIAVPMTEFTLPRLTTGKIHYDASVEVAILTTMDANYARLKTAIGTLGHPVIAHFQSDSWNYVNRTESEDIQADYLKAQIKEVLPLHTEQLMSGVSVTEWSDQYWKGKKSDPDFDCPDLSNFRHSLCGVRVVELHDGMLTSEYMGINGQYQTWFKHCIKHKRAYYAMREVFMGLPYLGVREPDSCLFVNRTWNYWVFVWIATGVIVFCTLLLIAAVAVQGLTSDSDTYEMVEDEANTRWVQPDTDQIYELIMAGTTNLLEQKPFVNMNMQRIAEAADEGGEEEVEVDSWDFCRWQVVAIQLDRLQKIIFDEMLCQIRIGEFSVVGEHPAGFANAVSTLHTRYTNSYLGWLDDQTLAERGLPHDVAEALGTQRTHYRWEIVFGEDETADDGASSKASYTDEIPDSAALDPEEDDFVEQAWMDGRRELELQVAGITYRVVLRSAPISAEPVGELRGGGGGGPQLLGNDGVDMDAGSDASGVRAVESVPEKQHSSEEVVGDVFEVVGGGGGGGGDGYGSDSTRSSAGPKRRDSEGGLVRVGCIYRRVRNGVGESTNDKLVDMLSFFCIWHLGEQMTWFNGHWLSWCFHYFVKNMKFPPVTVTNDTRHFCQRAVTMDDINESCAIANYFDIEGTRGLDEGDNSLKKEGKYNENEIARFPFRKTFREPLQWGIIFSIIHNIYFIVHTQIMSFIFWGLVVNVSNKNLKLADQGISSMFDRMELVFFHSPDDLVWILTTCAKVDFWLVVVGEVLDLWMIGGLYHYTEQDWEHTFHRVRMRDYIKLRWSSYMSVISFLTLVGFAFFEDQPSATDKYILAYMCIRVIGIVANNIILVMYPVRLRGAPRIGQMSSRRGAFMDFLGSVLFWGCVYGSVQLFQAWVMFRTETVGWDFCECENEYLAVTTYGAGDFFHNFFGKMAMCAKKDPRCFTAVFLIWVSSMLMFIVVVNAGFVVWVVLFGSFTHLYTQWKSKKARSLVGKKVQTAYILRSLNVKMLGFTDPRDTQVARKVWNRIIKEMWDEYLISAFEYENLLIQTHVSELQFTLRNSFAMERLSNFLQYIQSTELEEEMGSVSSYPSMSIVVPVYGEDLVCAAANTSGAFNEKIRSHQQEFTQLAFLIESYPDEWVNFVEHSVLDEEYFHEVLDEEQVAQLQEDVEEVKVVTDEKQKREMKGDKVLRRTCADIISDRIHTQPHLFYEEELVAVQWWASMHMQTVARTIRGMERKREAFRFLLELEQAYTHTEKTRQDKIDLLTDDKVQVMLCLNNMANNKWFSRNESGLLLIWQRYPMVEVTFIIDTINYRNSPKVVRKVHEHVEDLWDCAKYLSCLALWNEDEEDWFVASAYARRNTFRLEKNARYGLNGLMQGKAMNQAHSMCFTRGQLIQAIDCNQDGYFDEALKIRTVLGKFFPNKDRRWSEYKIVGFPEYSTTTKSGVIGRIAGYAEYIFVNVFQKVLAHPLSVRMHYGHPDFFDVSWVLQQGGMSKSNPLINLNEDIFAGFHVTQCGEKVDHVSWMRDGKGRETNFDGANGFQIKLAFGASMQYRTRDQYELMRTSDVLKRHSILYGSVGPYLYLITIVFLIYTTLLINISLAYANKTDYSLTSRGSPYGSEWMIQMSLIEAVPLLIQLMLDFGLIGLLIFIRDVLPTTLFFLFIIMTKFFYFIQSSLNGGAQYIATGRSDPLFRRSIRHMFRYYGSTHFMPGMFLLAIVLLYIDVEPRGIVSSLLRTFWHWGVALAFIVAPICFNPGLSLAGLWEDLKNYYLWVFGEFMEKIKKQKDVLTKKVVSSKKAEFWEKAYEQLALKYHPANEGRMGRQGTLSTMKKLYRQSSGTQSRRMSDLGSDDFNDENRPLMFGEFGDIMDSEASDYAGDGAIWGDNYTYGAAGHAQSVISEDLEPVEFTTFSMPPAPVQGQPQVQGGYKEHSAPGRDEVVVGSFKVHEAYAEHGAGDSPDDDEPPIVLEMGELPPMPTGAGSFRTTTDTTNSPQGAGMHTIPSLNFAGGSASGSRLNIPPPEYVTKGDSDSDVKLTPRADSVGFRGTSSLQEHPLRPQASSSRGSGGGGGGGGDVTGNDLLFEPYKDDDSLDDSFMSTGKFMSTGAAGVPGLRLAGLHETANGMDEEEDMRYEEQARFNANPMMTARLIADKGIHDMHQNLDEELLMDFDWLEKNEKNKAELDRFLRVFRNLPGETRGEPTHGGRVPDMTVRWKAMQQGFIKLGKVVEDANCKELLIGLGLREVDFVQFVILFHKAEGKESGHGDYGIDRAATDINRARHRELRHIQRQMTRGKRGYMKSTSEAERIAVLTVLHNTRRQFRVEFRDSTEDKMLAKTNCLKHHWKVSQILAYRNSSTMIAFVFSIFMFGIWLFAYLSIWHVCAISPTTHHVPAVARTSHAHPHTHPHTGYFLGDLLLRAGLHVGLPAVALGPRPCRAGHACDGCGFPHLQDVPHDSGTNARPHPPTHTHPHIHTTG